VIGRLAAAVSLRSRKRKFRLFMEHVQPIVYRALGVFWTQIWLRAVAR